MEKKYFLNNDGNQSEPLSLTQLKKEYITPDTLVWTEGLEDWVTAGALEELKSIIRVIPPPIKKVISEGICVACGEFKDSINAKCPSCNGESDWAVIPKDLNENEVVEFINKIKKTKSHFIPTYDKAGNVKYFKEIKAKKTSTDPFAIASFAAGLGGFLILPIIFIPIAYVSSIVSYYRMNQDKSLGGTGLRVIGVILTTINIFWVMYTMKIGFFA